MSSATAGEHDDVHEAVFRAARELFAREGFSQVTIRAIAARAGVSPALVMKVGGSKREIFNRTATIKPPSLPDAPVNELGTALVADLIKRHRRGDLEHLGRAVALKLNAPDPEAVRAQFHAGYVEALAQVLDGSQQQLRAELAVASLVGLATMLRFFEPVAMTADLDAVEAQYGPFVQHLLDGDGG
jgi:AcrR family transcriptional regulator